MPKPTICLVRCPSPFLIDEKVFPPLGLMAVGTYYKQIGWDVHVFDGYPKDLPLDYDHYGFGPTTPEYPAAVAMMKNIKRYKGGAEHPNVHVQIGGPHASAVPTLCRDDGFDDVYVGRRFDGIIDRSLIDIKSYKYFIDGQLATTMLTSYGCPHQCSFCSKHGRYEQREVNEVLNEIDCLYKLGYRALMFFDDTFVLDRNMAEAVMYHLSGNMVWRCFVRGDLIVKHGQKFVDLMAECGCKEVGIGIESGSDQLLYSLRKGETIDQIFCAIVMLKRAGIKVKGFFIVGLPGETRDSIQETEEFLQGVPLDDADFTVFQPYPGSNIYDFPENYDISWDNVDYRQMFYKGRPGEYKVNVRTSALSADEILEARNYLERTYKPRR